MAKTDGYLCTGDEWLYANVGGEQGTITDPTTSGIRVRMTNDTPIPGTRVGVDGAYGNGPSINFSTPNGVLSGAAAAPGARPFIVWAGVSPLSLSEALIVWNTDIVLLNKNGVSARTGDDASSEVLAVVGRLMIIKLDEPIAINGIEQRMISILPGTVGFYKDTAPSIDTCEDQVGPVTTAAAGGSLTPPTPPTASCDCSAPITGSGGGGGGGLSSGQVYSLLFSTICNPAAQCGQYEGSRTQFVVNNGFSFPVRCTLPFYAQVAKTGGIGNCSCTTCARDAEAWEICLNLWGSTIPGEIFPLGSLQTFDPCQVGADMAEGYGGFLQVNVECSPACPTASVEIVGRFGPVVQKSGKWKDRNPGYEGQAIRYKPECNSPCPDDDCLAEVTADHVDCYVPEDIIKPIERTVPVEFFERFTVKTTSIVFPTALISTSIVVPEDSGVVNVTHVTEVLSTPIGAFDPLQIVMFGNPICLAQLGTTELSFIADVYTNAQPMITVPVTQITEVITDVISTIQTYSTVTKTVLTSNGGSLVTNIATQELTLALAGTPIDVKQYEASLKTVEPLSGTASIVTGLATTAITGVGLQTAYPVVSFATTEAVLIESIATSPAINFVTQGAAGNLAVISTFNTVALVYCTNGNVSTATVVVNLQTVALGTTNMAVVKDLTTNPGAAVVASITTGDIVTTSVVVPTSALTSVVSLVTNITAIPATFATVNVFQINTQAVTLTAFEVLAVATAELVYVSAITQAAKTVVIDISTAVVEPASVDIATEAVTGSEIFTTFGTIEYDIAEHNVVTKVGTEAVEALTAVSTTEISIVVPQGETSLDCIVEGDEITLITEHTEQNCDVQFKFLMHDGQIDWTSANRTEANCCETTSPACSPVVSKHPVENECRNFLLLRANYVQAHDTVNRDGCPGYDCGTESCEEDGGGPYESEPSGSAPAPCTVRVRRLNRRWATNLDCDRGGLT